MLGLKTVDIINDTLISIDKNKTIYDFYDNCPVDFYNAKYFKDIAQAKTDAIFQLESNLFKGMVREILPKNIDDVTAITSIGRPGPLAAHMDKLYAKRKNGEEEWSEPLPNTMDIVQDTFGTIIYQEQPMLIAQRVAGFNGNHADSYLRKALAKKKIDLLRLCQQWFTYGKLNEEPPAGYDATNLNQPMYDPTGKYGAPIKGGIANGYDEKQLNEFFSNLEGYASYLFNKSHAFAYSVLSCFSAYLAHHYRTEFMAQVLSIEEEKEKIDYYVEVCGKYNIPVLLPHINLSDEDFKVVNGSILYGIKTITQVGKTCEAIIQNRPYNSLKEMQERVKPRKNVFEFLIKAGCFDFINPNRLELLNEIYELRGDNKDKVPRFNPEDYNKEICREFEQAAIKTNLSYPCIYKKVPTNKTVTLECQLIEFKERRDKNSNMMGFYKLLIDDTTVDALCFSKTHTAIRLELEYAFANNKILYLSGKKDDKGKFLVSSLTKDASKVFKEFELPTPMAISC